MNSSEKKLLAVGLFGLLIVLYLSGGLDGVLGDIFGQNLTEGSITVTVVDANGMPIGSAESGFDWMAGALVNIGGQDLEFSSGYSIYVESLVKCNYTLSGSASGRIDGNWTASGTFINAALTEGSPTAKTKTGTYSASITSAGSGTPTLQASLGPFLYSMLDEDIPTSGSTTYTLTFTTTLGLYDANNTLLQTVTGSQSMTITLKSTISGSLSIVSITFEPWIETPTTGFF